MAEFFPGPFVRILARSGRAWTQEATVSVGAAGFGHCLAMSADRLVVGAPWAGDVSPREYGKVFVFRWNGASWLREAELRADDYHDYLRMGWSVAISGDTIVAGSVYDWGETGAAYVFRFDGTTWRQEAKLTASDGLGGDRFGQSVAIEGDTIVVGALWADVIWTASGAAYIFSRSNPGVWVEEIKLSPPSPTTLGYFGQSVELSNGRVLVGSQGADIAAPGSGEAYVFERYGAATWQLGSRLHPADAENSDGVGTTVALCGDRAIIGAPGDDDRALEAGAAYLFARGSDAIWREMAKFTAPDGMAEDDFSGAVALAGDTVVVGAARRDQFGIDSGAAYVFAISGDLDGDGVMDVCECLGDLFPDRTINETDLAIMLYYWNQGPGGDINRDGDTDEADLGLLLANWGTVCP
ncbi:MAG: hypothetical protein U1D55_10000 [Phycisphaerae bacterium]